MAITIKGRGIKLNRKPLSQNKEGLGTGSEPEDKKRIQGKQNEPHSNFPIPIKETKSSFRQRLEMPYMKHGGLDHPSNKIPQSSV